MTRAALPVKIESMIYSIRANLMLTNMYKIMMWNGYITSPTRLKRFFLRKINNYIKELQLLIIYLDGLWTLIFLIY